MGHAKRIRKLRSKLKISRLLTKYERDIEKNGYAITKPIRFGQWARELKRRKLFAHL